MLKYLLILLPLLIKAQKAEFNLVVNAGMNRLFFDGISQHRFGSHFDVGLRTLLQIDKKARIQFNPGIHYTHMDQITKTDEFIYVNLKTRSLDLDLQMLFKATSSSSIRLGFEASLMCDVYPIVIYRGIYPGVYSFSGVDVYKGIDQNPIQVKLVGGYSIPLRKTESGHYRYRLNITFIQALNSSLNSPYYVATFTDPYKKKVMDSGSLVSSLMLGIEYNLLAHKKGKKKEKDLE
jgi:hypothetical protein